MNLGIEGAYVFAESAADVLSGHWDRLEDYGRVRHELRSSVITRIQALIELARGQPNIVGTLRHYLIPGMTKFPPTAHAMLAPLTGLDHEVRTA